MRFGFRNGHHPAPREDVGKDLAIDVPGTLGFADLFLRRKISRLVKAGLVSETNAAADFVNHGDNKLATDD
jgi:hypothetical protein